MSLSSEDGSLSHRSGQKPSGIGKKLRGSRWSAYVGIRTVVPPGMKLFQRERRDKSESRIIFIFSDDLLWSDVRLASPRSGTLTSTRKRRKQPKGFVSTNPVRTKIFR